ncbi:MAG: 4-amino-4-deoxy-L-arabinose transferase-like glycosyltransferase [Candidatus Azotimanducaceae bacterium]|jgi:4-amino-4-deoxy-L-arabinose transferase-like glycosyltransferase
MHSFIDKHIETERLLRLSIFFLFTWIVHAGYAGMDMNPDGVLYATIANNMAQGIGSFWSPYSIFGENGFYHHPPLAFYLQSLTFLIFGNSFWVDNIYQIVMLILATWLLCLIWDQSGRKKNGWILLLMFMSMPVVAWSFTNNLLENTVTVLCLAAVYCQLRAVTAKQGWYWSAASGVIVIAAVLTKGPVGFYPLAALSVLTWVHHLTLRQASLLHLPMLGTFAVVSLALFLYPNSNNAIFEYATHQLVGTFSGGYSVAHGREYLVLQLIKNIAPAAIICSIFAVRFKCLGNRQSTGWLVIALMASLPLLISPRHFTHYIVPSIPLFALFFASWLQVGLKHWTINRAGIASVVLATTICGSAYYNFSSFGELEDHVVEIADLEVLMETIEPGEIVSLCSTNESYVLFAYLARYHAVSYRQDKSRRHLLCKESLADPNYANTNISLTSTNLYRRE